MSHGERRELPGELDLPGGQQPLKTVQGRYQQQLQLDQAVQQQHEQSTQPPELLPRPAWS